MISQPPYITFCAQPAGPGHWVITNIPHPKPYMFDLINRPVDADTYRQATMADYGPTGLFLDRLIIRRVVEGCIWRFASHERPWHLEQFLDGRRIDHPIEDDLVATLHHTFGISASVVADAVASLRLS